VLKKSVIFVEIEAQKKRLLKSSLAREPEIDSISKLLRRVVDAYLDGKLKL
jgi:hypothetical protein